MAIRAVVDTNVWVSSLLNPTGYPAQVRRKWEEGKFTLVLSDPLVDEFIEVLNRPRIREKYGIEQDTILELFLLIAQRADHVSVSGEITLCRDRDDNLIIETAIKGEAAYLVTRDDDLKTDARIVSFLEGYHITVVSVSEFLKVIP